MKLLDVNVLIYAHNSAAPEHERARRWFAEIMSGTEAVAFPWVTILGFIRLSTRAAVMTPALPVTRAMDMVEGWLARPCAVVAHPTPRHAAVLRGLLEIVGVGGNRTTDAHLTGLRPSPTSRAMVALGSGAPVGWVRP